MGVKTLIGSGMAGLGLLVLSLFTPMIPTNTYTFTARNDGKCEVGQDNNSLYQILGNNGGSDTHYRVVRINGNDADGGYAGTGYLSGGNTVLTAQHVAEGEWLAVTLADGHTYSARVLDEDPEADIALLELPSYNNGQFKGIKIGDVKEGGDTHTKTLSPEDYYYTDGSKSWIEVKQKRYIAAPKEIKTAEEAKKKVEAEIAELRREEDNLFEPYYTEEERAMLRQFESRESKAPERDSGYDRSMYAYVGWEGSSPVWRPGMSGSGVFNEGGELVGIISKYAGSTASVAMGGYYIPRNAPPYVIEKFNSILDERSTLYDELTTIKNRILDFKEPDTDWAVSPSAILDFLKSYCGSTASTRAN